MCRVKDEQLTGATLVNKWTTHCFISKNAWLVVKRKVRKDLSATSTRRQHDVNTTSTRRQNNYFMVEHLSKKGRLHSIIFEKSVKVLSNDILQS